MAVGVLITLGKRKGTGREDLREVSYVTRLVPLPCRRRRCYRILSPSSARDEVLVMEDDDVWGSGSDDELEREWVTRQAVHFNSGYREGLDEGKKVTLQKGFNAGFKEGERGGHEWGQRRGAISTLQALAGQLPGTSAILAEIQAVADSLAAQGTTKESARKFCDFRVVTSESADQLHAEDKHAPDGDQEGGTYADKWAKVSAAMTSVDDLAAGFGLVLTRDESTCVQLGVEDILAENSAEDLLAGVDSDPVKKALPEETSS
ncbi:hypothetical protein CYMTET_54155 [Cymbomonas tetramitiformis]|uniref:Essential protein Yae1 N-terminal domain-containing protein n=1 Tax=Cymbomonas tetramitiformis TaxID=36881 RepID=A0AAE0EPM8_9CHLO|nr:hypothetical protein CYMTET_54155 [Cymbomonas tetramitiformis]